MASHPVETLITVAAGPFGVARACKLCRFHSFRPKVPGAGRGAGFREGNKQRGIVIQHIKAEHPAEYSAAMANARKDRK